MCLEFSKEIRAEPTWIYREQIVSKESSSCPSSVTGIAKWGGEYVIEVNCANLYSSVFASVIWL